MWGCGTKKSAQDTDWDAVKQSCMDIMDNDEWDDGTIAPVLLRLGWHSAATFDASDSSGGTCGAAMRFPKSAEAKDPENAGLHNAIKFLTAVRNKHPSVSYSDLWILASYCALERTGGPVIQFEPGRADAKKAKQGAPAGRLPEAEHGVLPGVDEQGRVNGWENLAKHMHSVFDRMGMTDKEAVALICGGHVYGRCHPERSGYAGAWVTAPYKFSNEYAADMIEDTWMCVEHDTILPNGEPVPEEVRPAPGKRQYIGIDFLDEGDGEGSGSESEEDDERFKKFRRANYQMMLVSDMVLLWDPEYKKHLEVYAEDEEALKNDFGEAFKKLTELGVPGCPALSAPLPIAVS